MSVAPPFTRTDLRHGLPARVAAVAGALGGHVAVAGPRETLTYAALVDAAHRIAQLLVARGDGARPGPVALLLDHDAGLVAAALGVLAAGGLYLPLDPTGPVERSAEILVDAGARLLLTDARHGTAARLLAARTGGALQVLDVAASAALPARAPSPAPGPDDPACLVYTSGSTGRPKGVWHVHGTLVHGAWVQATAAGLGPDDRCSVLHGLGTMACATTLWSALCSGATVLPAAVRQLGPERLAVWIGTSRVTCLHAVPTVFRRALARVPAGRRLETVRLVRLGGEAVTRTEWDLWRTRAAAGARLQVGLAATELGVVCQALYGAEDAPPAGVVPVGRPVADTDVALVDADGLPVRDGEPGRLVVRSRYLFGGYWNRPAETAAVRDVDPDGRIVFRSGDVCRWDGAGRLVHVGRSDAQLKVDGHRVELAETEHALRAIPWVRDAAVVPRRRDGGAVRLVAFVTLQAGAGGAGAALRAHLRERLPDPLVPAAFVVLDELPVVGDGKIDRAALAARAASATSPHVAPRNPVEETLVEVWQRALGAAEVGVDDDFFLALGGDSLAAVQVLSETATIFGRELPLDTFHDATTVAAMAARIRDEGWRPADDGRLVVHAGGARRPLFGLCGAYGHALRLLLVGHALGPERPFHGLQPPGMDWERAGCATVAAMAAHYRRLVRTIQPQGPYRLLGTSFGGVLAYEIVRQLEAEGARVSLLAMVDTMPPDTRTPDGVDATTRRDWGTADDVADPLVAAGARVARAHGAAMASYLMVAPVAAPILYFRCAEPAVAADADRRRLWAHVAGGGLEVVPVPGWHGHFHREPQFSVLVAALRARLDALDAAGA